jgi:hypothetical protein
MVVLLSLEYLANKVLFRVVFFAWSAALEKILTTVNLRKRHIIVIDFLHVQESGESVDHIIVHCEIAIVLWNAIFSLYGLDWVMPIWVVDILAF